MSKQTTEDLVRQCFLAWENSDRAALEKLLADEFTFTSPHDDHIDLAEYWSRCWPGRDMIESYQLEQLFVQGDEAFVRYTCQLTNGNRFQNTEFFTCANGKITGVDVYFGRSLEKAY